MIAAYRQVALISAFSYIRNSIILRELKTTLRHQAKLLIRQSRISLTGNEKKEDESRGQKLSDSDIMCIQHTLENGIVNNF